MTAPIKRPWSAIVPALALVLGGLWLQAYAGLLQTPWRIGQQREMLRSWEAQLDEESPEALKSMIPAMRRQAESRWYPSFGLIYGTLGIIAVVMYGISAWAVLREQHGPRAFVIMTVVLVTFGLVKPAVRYFAWSFPPLGLLGSVVWPLFLLTPLAFVTAGVLGAVSKVKNDAT